LRKRLGFLRASGSVPAILFCSKIDNQKIYRNDRIGSKGPYWLAFVTVAFEKLIRAHSIRRRPIRYGLLRFRFRLFSLVFQLFVSQFVLFFI
jgi:hypothetical protein